jgi:PmbA protein
MFGAAPVPSGAYPVLLRHDVAASLLATFADAFSAESVQRGLSLLTGRLGEAIASPLVTLVDDPFLADGSASAPFDAEGVATVRKEVISSGVLTTYLHNLKTARKDGVRSTGNAARASHKAPVGVAPSNFVLSPGPLQFGELVAAVENGLLVTAVQGLHSGANPVSGDFSLGATGYRIVNGSITAPVDQITLAGNFFRLLAEVEAVGDDLDFTGSFGAPTLRVRALSVAGK